MDTPQRHCEGGTSGAPALRALLQSYMQQCTSDEYGSRQRRANILGLADKAGANIHPCMDGTSEERERHRLDLMQALASGLVWDLLRSQWCAEAFEVVLAVSRLAGIQPAQGAAIFLPRLLAQLRCVSADKREDLLASCTESMAGETTFADCVLRFAAEHGQRSAGFVADFRDAVLHEFAEGGLSEPGAFDGGHEFTALVNAAHIAAVIETNSADAGSLPARQRTRQARL